MHKGTKKLSIDAYGTNYSEIALKNRKIVS
jgi:hypothetical protein